MKKFKKWALIFVLFGLIFTGSIITSRKLKAYQISDFSVTSVSSFDDFYTDLNGFDFDHMIKGYYTINNKKEFFIAYSSNSSDVVVLCTTYIYTIDESIEFVDGYAVIYDSDLTNLISLINNYLSSANIGYNTLLSDSSYFIINNYIGSVGYAERGNIYGLVRSGFEGSIISEPYNDFISKFGSLNSTYSFRALYDYVDLYYSGVIDDITNYYVEQIDITADNSYAEGYSDGLSEEDNTVAYDKGFDAGYTKAIEDGEQVTGYVFGLWDTFMNGIRNMFNVDIFGINLSAIIFFVISLGIIGFVLRRIF